MDNPFIYVENLRKVYKVHQREEGMKASFKSLFHREYKMIEAVSDVSFQIQKGEIRGLIGPNGSGKSTTIKILSGIIHPSEGKVNVMGLTPWINRDRYVRNIGVVFGQKSQLWWDLPAVDTFSLQKEMYKIPADIYRKRISFFSELLNIGEVMKKPVRLLSLGERMKCELVCAMIHEPELIFLDEPTIGLDILSKETIRQFIKQINKEKQTTFIITTHDFTDLEDLCEKVTIINRGTVVFDDLLEKLQMHFSNKKTIDLTFHNKVCFEDLIGFSVLEYTSISASIEVELSRSDLRSEILKILGSLPVKDINISNIKIEEVIKEIYRT